MIVECNNSQSGYRNTGAVEQCLEGLTIRTAFTPFDFAFDTATLAKTKASWDQAIADKLIFPLYEVEELASANVEAVVFEGRSRQYVTTPEKEIITYSSFLGLCSHRALKSFHNKPGRLFQMTEDGAILGVADADGKVKGRSVVLNVGTRLPATTDRPPSTLVTVNFTNSNEWENSPAKLYPVGWNPATDLFGIFDTILDQVSASSTVIKLTASAGCAVGEDLVMSLEDGDFIVRNGAGAVQSVTFTAPDADGVYTLTGTGFADGFTVEIDGVVTKTNISYESPEKLVLNVT